MRHFIGQFGYVDPKLDNAPITVHGFRSTFSDWADEETHYDIIIKELCLHHKVGDEVYQAYHRGDRLKDRFELLEEWAQYCVSQC